MNAETRIRLQIGDLVIQVQAAQARIEELEGKLKSYEANAEAHKPNSIRSNGRQADAEEHA